MFNSDTLTFIVRHTHTYSTGPYTVNMADEAAFILCLVNFNNRPLECSVQIFL